VSNSRRSVRTNPAGSSLVIARSAAVTISSSNASGMPIERHTLHPQEAPPDHLYEPSPEAIFAQILPKHVEIQVWRALLESNAAELGARMTAMDSATNNASEMIDRLTLYMNKVRQAAITKEIIEVVSGAGAPS